MLRTCPRFTSPQSKHLASGLFDIGISGLFDIGIRGLLDVCGISVLSDVGLVCCLFAAVVEVEGVAECEERKEVPRIG